MNLNINSLDIEFINTLANEIILYDIENEGLSNGFNWSLLKNIPFNYDKLIVSGGIAKGDIKKAKQKEISSVLVENKVLHQEYSILGYKNEAKLF